MNNFTGKLPHSPSNGAIRDTRCETNTRFKQVSPEHQRDDEGSYHSSSDPHNEEEDKQIQELRHQYEYVSHGKLFRYQL
jgi:hypothetical protein